MLKLLSGQTNIRRGKDEEIEFEMLRNNKVDCFIGDSESMNSKSVQKNVKIIGWIDKYTERKRSEKEFENFEE